MILMYQTIRSLYQSAVNIIRRKERKEAKDIAATVQNIGVPQGLIDSQNERWKSHHRKKGRKIVPLYAGNKRIGWYAL